MIHYHGGPMTPETVAYKVWRARHGMVSFAEQRQIEVVAKVCQSFALDNGAFSAWRSGQPITEWHGYYQWVQNWVHHPGFDWAVIPDVVDGGEKDNDALLDEWPFACKGVPVWHMHESMQRLDRLANAYERVAIGSSGKYATVGTPVWWRRMGEAMRSVMGDDEYPRTKLHGLRMLNWRVFSRLPFSSADSTNVARNVGIDKAWDGPYLPNSKETRGLVLAERIEEWNSAPKWRELTEGTSDWIDISMQEAV